MPSGRLRRQERDALRIVRAKLQQLAGDSAQGLAELETSDWAQDSELSLQARILQAGFLEAMGFPERAIRSSMTIHKPWSAGC